jgi:hypothetical protein
MAWVAADRAVKATEEFHLDGPVERWTELREAIRAEILDKGYDPRRKTFTQFYGSEELDAALLMVPLVGFLPATDEHVVGTVAAIEEHLIEHGFVQRYTQHKDTDVDGLPPGLRSSHVTGDTRWYFPLRRSCSISASAVEQGATQLKRFRSVGRPRAVKKSCGVIAQCPPVGAQVGVVATSQGQVQQVCQSARRLPGAVQGQSEITKDHHVVWKQAVRLLEDSDGLVEALKVAQCAAVACQAATQFGASETCRDRPLVQWRGQVWIAGVIVSSGAVVSRDRAVGMPGCRASICSK